MQTTDDAQTVLIELHERVSRQAAAITFLVTILVELGFNLSDLVEVFA